MKAILIDVEKQEVRTVTLGDPPKLQDYYDHIKCEIMAVSDRLNQYEDVCYVDDEGLLKDPIGYFQFGPGRDVRVGNGLIVGTDENGNSIEPRVTLNQIKRVVQFFKPGEITAPEPYFDMVEIPIEEGADGFDKAIKMMDEKYMKNRLKVVPNVEGA